MSVIAASQGLTDYLEGWGAPTAIILVVLVLLSLKQALEGAGAFFTSLRSLLRAISPKQLSRTNRQSVAVRQRIANVLLQQLDILEADLQWRATDFQDFRVTVEALDSPTRRRSRFFGVRRAPGIYRTQSLSKALSHEGSSFVLLQGAPGSGKSVALRQYARTVLTAAATSRFVVRPLCFYVSARDLSRVPQDINAEAILDYIKAQVNPSGSAELATYLDASLSGDLLSGKVTILLDSFDEIPAIFASTSIDRAVMPYVQAIIAFMGASDSRCIVASREYKGPRVPGRARLQLVGLTFEEQVGVLKTYGLSTARISEAAQLLLDPRAGFATDLRNPLYLALLARYIKNNGVLPDRPPNLFEDYINDRLKPNPGDGGQIKSPPLEGILESFAFALTRQQTSGLSVEPSVLLSHVESHVGAVEPSTVLALVDSIRQSNLVIESRHSDPSLRRIAFAHRRIQEFFATKYVIQHTTALSPGELAANGRWRETAVTLLQVASSAETEPVLLAIETLLREAITASTSSREVFAWSRLSIHCLEIVVAAYGNDPRQVPHPVAGVGTELVEQAWSTGTIADRKFALDCLPAVTTEMRVRLVDEAFAGDSQWLRLTALRECARLHPLPRRIDSSLRRLLISMLGTGELSRDRSVLDADLRRLYRGALFVTLRRLVVAVPVVIAVLCALKIVDDFTLQQLKISYSSVRFEFVFWVIGPFGYFWLFQSSSPLSYEPRSRVSRLFTRIMRYFGFRGARLDTEALALTIAAIVALLVLNSLIFSIVDIVRGRVVHGILAFLFDSLACLYAFAWGPSLLVAIRFGLLGDRAALTEAVLVFVRVWRPLWTRIQEFGKDVLGAFARALVIQGVFLTIVLGSFWLLHRFAGRTGDVIVLVVRVTFALILPLIIITAVGREWIRRRRVRRAVLQREALTPAALLDTLNSFSEPSQVAEYLRLVRVRRSDEARTIPKEFVRELSALIASASSENDVGADAHDGALRRALEGGTALAENLGRWRGEVLDELGLLEEFLRER